MHEHVTINLSVRHVLLVLDAQFTVRAEKCLSKVQEALLGADDVDSIKVNLFVSKCLFKRQRYRTTSKVSYRIFSRNY